jgi:hypothetical protein
MKPSSLARWLSTLGVAALLMAVAASAADVHVMISAGFYGVYSELGPVFERASGHRLVTGIPTSVRTLWAGDSLSAPRSERQDYADYPDLPVPHSGVVAVLSGFACAVMELVPLAPPVPPRPWMSFGQRHSHETRKEQYCS